MTTPLPPESEFQTPDEHMQISRRVIEHARDELEKGDRLQASEKIWGAVNHALASIGKERGWITEKYENKKGVANVLARERDDPFLSAIYAMAELHHQNFYQNSHSSEIIATDIHNAEVFVDKIEQTRGEAPQDWTPEKIDLHWLLQATGRNYLAGEPSTNGFVDASRLERYRRRWDNIKAIG